MDGRGINKERAHQEIEETVMKDVDRKYSHTNRHDMKQPRALPSYTNINDYIRIVSIIFLPHVD